MRIIHAAFALLALLVAPSWAATVTQVTEVKCDLPVPAGAKASYSWYGDKGLVIAPNAAGDSARVSPASGITGHYSGIIAQSIDGGPKLFDPFDVRFGDAPAPTVKTLRDLVPDDKTAALNREFYIDLSVATAKGNDPSVAKFWETHDSFYKDMRVEHSLPSNPKLGEAITEKINALFDGAKTIDAELRAKLVDGLLAIANEFGQPQTPPDIPPVIDPVKPTATAAAYIYEKDDTAVPVWVSTGINRLNRERNIVATLFEEDTVDGEGQVPDQYKAALEAAQKTGLPAFVVMVGNKVLTVVKDPKTEDAVMEAVR